MKLYHALYYWSLWFHRVKLILPFHGMKWEIVTDISPCHARAKCGWLKNHDNVGQGKMLPVQVFKNKDLYSSESNMCCIRKWIYAHTIYSVNRSASCANIILTRTFYIKNHCFGIYFERENENENEKMRIWKCENAYPLLYAF